MTLYILGFDGATFDLIDQWADELPHFQQLKDKASWGPLETTVPPITAAAWSSFLTGKNPGKHGIYDFSVRKADAQNDFQLVHGSHLDSYTFYDYLNDHDVSTGTFNIPLTNPPPDLDGYVIAGGPIAELGSHATIPESLWDEIEDLGGLWRHSGKFTGENEDAYIASHHEQLDQFEDVYFHLLDNYDTDLHAVLFQNTDTLSHWMWKYHDPDHPDHPAEKNYDDCIKDIYKRADEILGRMMDRMDNDDYLLVMSDHGFGPIHKSIYINNLLHEHGLLTFKRTPGTLLRRALFRLGIDLELADRVGTRLGLKNYARKSQKKNDGDGGLLFRFIKSFFLSADDIDWKRTKAFSRANFGQIFLNRDLTETERAQVKEEVKEVLYDLDDPETGEQVITDIKEKENLYHGNNTDMAPDLVFFTRNMQYMPARHFEFGSRRIITDEPVRNGHHRMHGIFYLQGPDVAEGKRLDDLHIMDVAPAVIHAFDLPVPDDMDGDVPDDAFTSDRTVEQTTYTTIDGETGDLDL